MGRHCIFDVRRYRDLAHSRRRRGGLVLEPFQDAADRAVELICGPEGEDVFPAAAERGGASCAIGRPGKKET